MLEDSRTDERKLWDASTVLAADVFRSMTRLLNPGETHLEEWKIRTVAVLVAARLARAVEAIGMPPEAFFSQALETTRRIAEHNDRPAAKA